MPCAKAGERRDEQPLLAERRPVALGVLDQLVGLRHPDGAAAALEPVVEQDAGDLAALAGAGAVAEHPAAPEAHGVLGAVGRGRDRVEGLVDVPCAGEKAGMRLARIDDAFELGIGQQPVGDDGGRQMRAVGRLRRGDRGHRGRLHEPGRVRLRARNADRLQRVAFVERLADAGTPTARRPVAGLIGELRRRIRNERPATARPGATGGRGRIAAFAGIAATGAPRGSRRDRDRRPRRNVRGSTQSSSVAASGAMPSAAGNAAGSSAGTRSITVRRVSVRGAVAGIDAAVDGGREHHAAAFLQPHEILAPGRIVGDEIGARDGDQAAAFGEARQRRADMAQRGVGDPALDMGRGREGRVHQHDARANAASR